jgi:hypothetical protein
MQKLVARTMIVMLLTTALSGLFAARPAQARSGTGRVLLLGAIAGGLYYLYHRRQEKRERGAMLPSDSKYMQSNRTAQASGATAAPGSIAAGKSTAAAEASPVGGSVSLGWPTPTAGTISMRQPIGSAQ